MHWYAKKLAEQLITYTIGTINVKYFMDLSSPLQGKGLATMSAALCK